MNADWQPSNRNEEKAVAVSASVSHAQPTWIARRFFSINSFKKQNGGAKRVILTLFAWQPRLLGSLNNP
ncbi:MAG: hypothetical protein ACKO6H_01250, partial [Betaproteobacteria bacterium]